MVSNTLCVEGAKSLLEKEAVVFVEVLLSEGDDKATAKRDLESLGCLVAEREDRLVAFTKRNGKRCLTANGYPSASCVE